MQFFFMLLLLPFVFKSKCSTHKKKREKRTHINGRSALLGNHELSASLSHPQGTASPFEVKLADLSKIFYLLPAYYGS